MLTDNDIMRRISMEGKRANYLKLRRGIFDDKHVDVLRGEVFRVFVLLTALANIKDEPKSVAEVMLAQVARKLKLRKITVRRAVRTLEDHGYVRRLGSRVGFLIEKTGSQSDPIRPQVGVKKDPPEGQKVTPAGSESDPLGVKKDPSGAGINRSEKRRNTGEEDLLALLAERPVPKVEWIPNDSDFRVDLDWLREELRGYAAEAGVTFTKEDFEHEREALRLRFLADRRLTAVSERKDGTPSTERKFREMASYTLTWFKTAIRRKASYAKRKQTRGEQNLDASKEALRRYLGNDDQA